MCMPLLATIAEQEVWRELHESAKCLGGFHYSKGRDNRQGHEKLFIWQKRCRLAAWLVKGALLEKCNRWHSISAASV